MNLDLRLVRQIKQAGWALAGTILLGIFGGVLVLLQARRLTAVIARVFLGGQTLADVVPLLGVLLVIFLLRSGVTLLGEVSAGAAAARIKSGLRETLFRKLLALGPLAMQDGDPSASQHTGSGELAAAALQGVEALDAYFSQYLPQVVLAAAIPVILLVAVFPIDLLSGAILLLTAPLIPVFMILIGRAAETLTRRQFTALSRMSAFFLDTLQGLATLKMLGQSQRQAGRISAVSEHYRIATMTVLRVTFLSALALELVATLSTAVIAVQIGLRLLYGRVGFEQAFFILVVAPEFYLPLRLLGQRFHAGMSGVSAAKSIFAILDLPETEPDVSPARRMAAQRPLRGEDFTLAFENVRFAYPGRAGEALAGVSFQVLAGQQVALVGPTGSGKSTIAALLLRFLSPLGGRITLDGRDIAEIPVEAWRDWIAWVPQTPYLFHDTIAANLRIAKGNASLEDLRAAARLAHLEAVIDALPRGFDTIIGEHGARLSGGQAQRLALARAFLKDAPVLLLDEPTAYLDPESEALFRESLGTLSRGRTAITIAHSLPAVIRADQILVLEHGRLVEQGTHAGLARQGGLYARLARARGEEG